MEHTKVKMTPKDFFLWLATMATLYVSAISLLTLWFQYINVLFPDQLERYGDPYSGPIRFAIASLIIIFPLYIFLTRLLNQDLRKHAEKKELGIRKWLIFITLFVAGATIVGDLIALINAFLGGDLTTRFILKVLSVLVVIGGAFGYYWLDLKGKWEREAAASKTVALIIAIAVFVSIVGGFFILGSPQSQRLIRFDQQKISDLQNIQWQIVNYWQSKEKLPTELSLLEDPISGYVVPTDPQTEAPYGYRVTGALGFELCAEFNREGDDQYASYARPVVLEKEGIEGGSFRHGEGEVCFERTIDPELYPPREIR